MDAFIMIFASPTRFAYKHIQIEVCGYENLTAKVSSSDTFFWDNPVGLNTENVNMSYYFTSNVTKCTFTPWLYNYTLVPINNSYDNAVALSGKPQINFNALADILYINKYQRGIMSIFVMASADSQRYGYKHLHFHICGFENLVTKVNSTNIFYDNPVPIYPIIYNLSNNFTNDDDRCTYTWWNYTYKLVNSNKSYEAAIPLTGLAAKNFHIQRENFTTLITTPGIFDIYILIEADINPSQRHAFMHFNYYICGFEEIIVQNKTIIEYHLSTATYKESIKINVTEFFNNTDPKCGFFGHLMNYTLVSTNSNASSGISEIMEKNLHFEKGDILVIELNFLGTETVFVMASADSNRYAFKQFFFNFTTPIPELVNQAPLFESEVKSSISVDVSYDSDNKLKGTDTEVIYTTPKVYDKEDERLKFSVSITPESPYITAVNNKDNTTTITVNKLKVAEKQKGIPGKLLNKVKITVKDKSENSLDQEILVNIDYKNDAYKPYIPPISDPKPNNIRRGNDTSYEKMPEPTISVMPITPDGIIEIKFDQEMEIPEGEIVQSRYKDYFVCSITSAVDKRTVFTRFGSSDTNTKRVLEEDSDNQQKEDDLKFDIIVTEHTPTNIKMQLKFASPESVSSTRDGNDIINFRIIDYSKFKSKKSGKSINAQKIKDNVISKSLPPIIADPNTSKNIRGATQTSKTALNFLSSSNFFVGIILGGSMQQLWGMIRSMQLLILCAVVKVSFPAHTFMFFQGCMLFAKMDILSGESFYNTYFQLKETDPLNSNFEQYGYESKSYFLNSGSIFLFQGMVFGLFLSKFLINKIAIKLAKNPWARKLGMWAFEQNYMQKHRIAQMKLFLESYFEQTMCSILSLIAFVEAYNNQDLSGFFNTPGNIFQSLVSIGIQFMILAFPLHGYAQVIQQFKQKKLQFDSVKANLGIFYEEVKITHWSTLIYNFVFMTRRLLTALVLILLEKYPFFQIQFLLIFSTFNFIYMFSYRPFIQKKANLIEIFNEFCILLAIHETNILLNEALPAQNISQSIPISAKSLIGWIMIGTALLNVVVNLALTLIQTVRDLYKNIQKSKEQKFIKEAIKSKLENRKYLTQEWKGAFEGFDSEMELLEAIEFNKMWLPQRRWLKKNKSTFDKFDEEKTFLSNLKKFKMMSRARSVKLFQEIEKAANKLTEEDVLRKKQEIVNNKMRAKSLFKFKKAFAKKFTINNNQKLDTIAEESDIEPETEFAAIKIDEIKRQNVSKILRVVKGQMKNHSLPFDNEAVKNDLKVLSVKAIVLKNNKLLQSDIRAEKLTRIFKQEQEGYINSSNKKYESSISQALSKMNDLQFLVEGSDEEVDEKQLHDLVTQDCPYSYDELIENDGLRSMMNPGINNVVQSVLQSLFPIQPLIKYFIKKEYEQIGRNTQLCDLMHIAFVNNYKPVLSFFKTRHYQFDIAFFTTFLQKISFNVLENREDAANLYALIFNIMENEVSSKIKTPSPTSEELLVLFKSTVNRHEKEWYAEQNQSILTCLTTHMMYSKMMCKYGHQREEMRKQTIFKFKLTKQGIIKDLQEKFIWRDTDTQCTMCSQYIVSKEQVIETFAKLPTLLVFENEIFDEEGKVSGPNVRLKPLLNLNPLFEGFKNLIQNTNSVYRLVSFVAFKGDNKQTGDYTSFSERNVTNPKNKELKQKFWFRFDKDEYEITNTTKLLKDKYYIQLLFYIHEPSITVEQDSGADIQALLKSDEEEEY